MSKFFIILLFSISVFSKPTESSDKQKINLARELIFTNPQKTITLTNEVIRNNSNYSIKNKALSILINAQLVLQEYQSVIENSKIGIELANENNDTLSEVKYLSMLGNLYQSLFYNEKAKYYLNLAENKMEGQKLSDDILFLKANVYTVKGIIFRGELNSEFALKYFQKALNVFNQLPKDKSVDLNRKIIEIQIGFCYIDLKEKELATRSFTNVLNSKDPNLGFNKFFANVGIAKILISENKNKEALEILNSIPIDRQNMDIELKSMLFLEKSNAYLESLDFKQFISSNDEYIKTISDINKDQERIINKMINDSNKQTEEKVLEINSLNCIFMLFLVVISVFLYIYVFRRNFKI